MDKQSYRINHMVLRIPTRPGQFVFLTLRASNYQLALIDDPCLKTGSITLTKDIVSVSLSKEYEGLKPLGAIGVDVNERNVTTADSTGRITKYDTSEVAEIKERYKRRESENRPAYEAG